MKTKRYFIKQLTPAEVGDTGTHEKYIRCPNNFDFQSFFQQNGTMNGTVLEINFSALDLTPDSAFGSSDNMRFVHYINNINKEKRIPGLSEIYSSHNVKAEDIVKLMSTTQDGRTTFSIKFCNQSSLKLSDTFLYYEEKVSDEQNSEVSLPEIVYNEYLKLLRENLNIVLTGAPGTGKTYTAKQLAAILIGNCCWSDLNDEQKSQVEFVQFHPSYDYTDFVEGLRPDKDGNFIRTDGAFKAFCKKAIEAGEDIPYVFIIDEINRGEISKIFGELFYTIEPDYRGSATRVKTQYGNMVEDDDVFKGGFYVPKNVFIIGTMNDIDRSVEAMDFAIRRRFAWKEVTAEESATNMGLPDLSRKKMDALNNALKKNGLSEAYFIGGAYFRKLNGADYESLWNFHLKGIVSEYFRGEPESDAKVKIVEKAYNEATIVVEAEASDISS